MIKVITKKLYHCTCEALNPDETVCGHEWDSATVPKRCAKCKRTTWNASDKRIVAPEKKKKRTKEYFRTMQAESRARRKKEAKKKPATRKKRQPRVVIDLPNPPRNVRELDQ